MQPTRREGVAETAARAVSVDEEARDMAGTDHGDDATLARIERKLDAFADTLAKVSERVARVETRDTITTVDLLERMQKAANEDGAVRRGLEDRLKVLEADKQKASGAFIAGSIGWSVLVALPGILGLIAVVFRH